VIGVSKLGEFLRRTDLNNLPNFYNVLNGDLSIVGTTVLPATLVERNNVYKDEVDLKGIKPGFISLYQVYHPNVVFGGLKVKELNIDDVIGYDLFYINNKSLLLDIKILYRFFIFFIGYATPEKVNLNIDKANTFVDESRVLHHVD
jgi:lipopolysaccharide/colanic/teichoic acid biosynthesis glycosyltransferase